MAFKKKIPGDSNTTGDITLGDAASDVISITGTIAGQDALRFEGATANNFETTLRIVDPTADRIINLPNAAGTICVSGSSTTVQGNLDLSVNASGAMSGSAEGLATTDSPTFAGLTVSTTNNLTVRSITAGAAATTGTITGTWGLSAGSTLTATYADLAEKYTTDLEYDYGTVLVFGGEEELTTTDKQADHRVAGVVSKDPAYIMNGSLKSKHTVFLALQGRVLCKVIGRVKPGDILVTSSTPGYATVDNSPKTGTIIGKAINSKKTESAGYVEIFCGKS
jgi:hypothetical protein